MSRIVVVTGTGTEIGKTHTAEALLRVLGRTRAVLGYKPIESGVLAGEGDDGRRLREASTFHVKQPPFRYLFRAALSPHVAARREGVAIAVDRIIAEVRRLASEADVLLVELAGGLFSPVTDALVNADLLARLGDSRNVLVASDRLGVIHDVTACVRAADRMGIGFTGVVLSAPASADGSTGANAEEIRRFVDVHAVAAIPRADARDIASSGALDLIAAALIAP